MIQLRDLTGVVQVLTHFRHVLGVVSGFLFGLAALLWCTAELHLPHITDQATRGAVRV
jgi:hypothetical protein